MKVLFVNHFPLEGSGSGTYTKNLAMQLVARGHEVCVIMPENREDFPRYEGVNLHPVMFTSDAGPAPAGALPFNFPCFTTHPTSDTTFSSLDTDQFAAYEDAFRAAITQEVEQFAPDVIHGQHVWVLSALAAEAGVPLVLTVHGTDLMGYDKWLHLRDYATRALEACSKAICISKDNEQLALKTFPAYASKFVRMSNGYNPAIFHPLPVEKSLLFADYGVRYTGERIVLLAGKLTHFKGIDVFVDAMALCTSAAREANQVPPLALIAGDGTLRDELEEQVARLELDNVYFLGNVSQEELCRLYNAADMSVVPSRREPFGLVAVEAMACGTPVVATREGGLPDFVNDSVGALVPVDDAPALAEAIKDVLARAAANPSWRTFVAGYAESSYSQAALIGELEDVYRSVAS